MCMATEAGEFIVGACVQHCFDCSIILYNVRVPGGGLEGLQELDVVGLNLKDRRAYLCEVTTHLHGMRPQVVTRIIKKHEQQCKYASLMLEGFTSRCMRWSPLVFPAQVKQLEAVRGLELVVNHDFKKHVDKLRAIAKKTKHDLGNPFMRTLQILEHLKQEKI